MSYLIWRRRTNLFGLVLIMLYMINHVGGLPAATRFWMFDKFMRIRFRDIGQEHGTWLVGP